mgnify:CR=1 FL=1
MDETIESEVPSEEPIDKTEENEDALSDIPDEEESLEKEEKEEKKDSKSSEIAQKIKYRERAKRAEKELEDTKLELERAKKAAERAPEGSEQEKAAKEYIAKLAEEVYEAKKASEKKEAEKELQRFEDKVDSVLEENPDIPESELLAICEELEVEPEVAAKIWKRQTNKPLKPKLPNPKRTITQTNKMEYTKEDKGKSLFQLGREAIEEAKKKGLI